MTPDRWIVTLERGKLTEMGSHDELMVNNGRYAQLYSKQMGLKPAVA